SLLTASGFGVQEWLAAGKGEARLSVLTEPGGGGFQIRCPEDRRRAILESILAELEKSWQKEYGDQAEAKSGLARLAWQKYFQLVNLWLKPEQALKGIAELKSSPLGSAMEADLAMIDPLPLREKLGQNKDALQRLARLFGKRSGLSLLTRYPLPWFQWVGAGVLVLSLLTASGFGVQEWLAAGKGEARLSVLTEQGGGGLVGLELRRAGLLSKNDPATKDCCVFLWKLVFLCVRVGSWCSMMMPYNLFIRWSLAVLAKISLYG
ncbi:MAG: hypothetical protein D3919_05665, partial [Candidatus Electrothrix sp. AW5]|nr:hypothetical protein [Candidatus Electrothrix gigas]